MQPLEIQYIESLLQEVERNGDAVALFRYPNEAVLHIVRCREASILSFTDVSRVEISDRGAFVFASYASSESNPLFLLPPEEELEILCPSNESTFSKHHFDPNRYGNRAEYERYSEIFGKFHQAVSEGTFDKLVLTRSHTGKFEQGYSSLSLFMRMLESYPDAFVSLVYLPQEGYWLTATPELLLAGSQKEWKTVSLAGTRPIESNESWSRKNRNEQMMVTDFISDTLSRLGCSVLQQETEAHKAGQIEHLKTEIIFTSPGNISAKTLLSELHPTPAVCGFPRSEARSFIEQTEHHSRRFYSGFLGFIAPGGRESRIYVNLRCVHCVEDSYTLYAGGGIMPESELASEWEESCFKMHTIGALI